MSNAKRRKTSNIWTLFTPIDAEFASCNMCKQKLSYKSTINNLRKHVTTRHPTVSLPSTITTATFNSSRCDNQVTSPSSYFDEEIVDDVSNQSTSTTSNIIEISSVSIFNTPRTASPAISKSEINIKQDKIASYIPKKLTVNAKKEIDDKLLQLFIKDYQPFRIVEDQGFKGFVKALNPVYQIPSRHFISKTAIPALYEECLHNTKELITCGSSFCLTTDCWTSRNTDSYIGLTVHFINDNYDFISLLLECSTMVTNHTSENLAREIRRIVNEWGIEEKIILTVSDNASNIKNALSKELDWKHFSCFAHVLNLIVTDALRVNAISEILEKVKVIVAHFKRSYISNEKLMSYQKNNGDQPLKLIQDVPTRWNSTYFMLERFSKIEIAIRSTVALLDKNLPVLTTEEWKIINELCQLLKPFEEVTRTVSGENYCSASLVIPLTHGLKNVCIVLSKEIFTPLVLEVLSKLQNGINTRLGNIESSATLSVCTFLDPRFKGIAFSNTSTAEHAKKTVISLLSTDIDMTEERRHNKIKSLEEANKTRKEELCVWNIIDKNVAIAKPRGTPISKALIEIQRYIDDVEFLPRQENPINWWKQNAQYFPNLANVARKYLCALGTSVPCERLFSKAGLLLSDRRSRLSRNTTKMLLFLNTNFRK